MTYKQFLEEVIIRQTKKIGLGENLAWHAFALDSISIEFIGKISRCKNSSEIDKSGNEKQDFINAIEDYFPSKYRPYADFLYLNLRCGMTHFFGPKSRLVLGTRDPHKRNLEILPDSRMLLIFDEFHNDLEFAVRKLIASDKILLNENFISVTSI